MSAVASIIRRTAESYAKAMAIIQAHAGNIEAAESLVETLNDTGGLDLQLCVTTHEHLTNTPAEAPQSISINVWVCEHTEATLRRAIADAHLHIASETERINSFGDPRTVITLSDIDGVEIQISRQALKVAA